MPTEYESAPDLIRSVPLPEKINQSTPPSLRLSKINMRLQYMTVTHSDLRDLGFHPANGEDLYHEADFPRMCAELIKHLGTLRAGFLA